MSGSNNQSPEPVEHDITEIIERIEALEKAYTESKDSLRRINAELLNRFDSALSEIVARVVDCEDSIDALAERS